MANAAGTAPAAADAVSSTPPHGDSTADAALDDANVYEGADQDVDSGDDDGPDTAQ
jgi:hypothetical protein